MTTTSEQLTVTGTVGSDAQLKKTSPKTNVKPLYDPIVDDIVEKPSTSEGKPFVIFSLAETRDTPKGKQTIWYSITSWNPNDQVKNLRKGDRVSVRGDFSRRTYTDSKGAERTELRIRLSELKVLHTKAVKQSQAEDHATTTGPTATSTIRGSIGTAPIRRESRRGHFATFSLVRNAADGEAVWYDVITDDYSDRILSLCAGDKVLVEGSVTVTNGRRTLRPDNLTILRRRDDTTCRI